MKLPFFLKRTSPKEYYFGLFLKDKKGIGCVFMGNGTKLVLLAKQEFIYSNAWENLTEDIDEVLFTLENETKSRIEKAIFFLFSHLIDNNTKEIKKPYLQKIRTLTKNLEIKPIGYIECYEAVVSYLQTKESAPLTAILIELDDTMVDIFIYKGGHKVHSFVMARTNNIIDDLQSAFDTLGKNILLPNRLLLYNSSDLVKESTQIITHKWSTDLFVQIPRVEILKEEYIIHGLQQIFENQIYQQSLETNQIQEKTEEVFGFVIGKDIKDVATEKETNDKNATKYEKEMIQGYQDDPVSKTKKIVPLAGALMNNFKRLIRVLGGRTKKQYYVVVGIVVCLLVFFGAYEFLFHKATIHINLPSEVIEKRIQGKGLIDEIEDGYITIQIATSSTNMKDVKVTTGKRDIGDKAKGEVTIFNFDEKDKTFPKGTVIRFDNLRFLTDEEIKVSASTLTSDASAKLPGKANVEVTAVDIGEESNIDRGSRLQIDELSSSIFFAINDKIFSGGTKKSIKTVSKKDKEDLEESLLRKAKDQKKDEIAKMKKEQITLIDSLIDFSLSDVVFSKEVGEEGDSLSLQAKVVAGYYYLNNKDMKRFLYDLVAEDIPEGYVVEDKHILYDVKRAKKNKDVINLELAVTAKATKKFDDKELISRSRFATVSSLSDIIESGYGISDYSIVISPRIPLLDKTLPLIQKNTEVRIESN